jgi:hypothetical protein
MSATESETERTAVKTYVPAYQRDEWDDHAAELDMSRSEYVRSMVQAGRKGFDPRGHAHESPDTEETESRTGSDTRGNELESVVRETLQSGPSSWDELFEAVAEDIESDLESSLERMQDRNEIRYSGPRGGYVLAE